ncbi:type I-E CRISPR-associated protein Cse2/CasB, partial [Rubrivirga sp.]|uniref:type I-E CRISPR-associated protein Cse2/CasB n=1 Tax=Rubrivirga sp. TaxID=1885344 RepID=UPI003C7901BA
LEVDAYLLVAALYALQASGSGESRGARDKTSFGGSARWLRREMGVGQESLDRRFGALLEARRSDLPHRLRQIVTLMSTRAVGVRYDQLLRDVTAWDDGRDVQRRWARDYWAGASS